MKVITQLLVRVVVDTDCWQGVPFRRTKSIRETVADEVRSNLESLGVDAISVVIVKEVG